jgi:proteic killer suppression protein
LRFGRPQRNVSNSLTILLTDCQFIAYSGGMIKSFTDKGLQLFWEEGSTRRLAVQNPKRIKMILDALHVARRPADLDLPGLRFHNLAPAQPSRYAVNASGNYRITFAFEKGDAVDVDLEDYH